VLADEKRKKWGRKKPAEMGFEAEYFERTQFADVRVSLAPWSFWLHPVASADGRGWNVN
jgi:hypothetical protein